MSAVLTLHSLANAEMRLLMARLLYTFDLQITAQAQDWTARQKSYLTWELTPLMIKLKTRK